MISRKVIELDPCYLFCVNLRNTALTFFMKNIILGIILFASSFLYAQRGTTAIENLLNQQTVSWNNGDIEGFMKTYWKNDSLMLWVKAALPGDGRIH